MRMIKNNVERIATTKEQEERLREQGFCQIAAERKNPKEETEKVQKKDQEKMTAQELKALAKEKGVEGAEALTKEELLAVLKDVV